MNRKPDGTDPPEPIDGPGPQDEPAPPAPAPAPGSPLPAQSSEDTDVGWGDYAEQNDDWLLRDRPPHWDR